MNPIVVITGGAGGMGLAAAKLIGQKHELLICDVNPQRLTAAKEELQQLGIRCEAADCDITDADAVNQLAQQAASLGKVNAVIHTAGLSPQMADPTAIMRVNAIGTINISNAFYEIAEEGFALVNVASMAAHMIPQWIAPKRAYRYAFTDIDRFMKKVMFPCRLMPKDFYRKGMAYSLSKHFVIWYSKKSAARFGAKGARILSVSPGSFDTEMGRLEEKSGSAEMLKMAALQRFGRPEEIAELLVFCASEKASYLTGTDILCDGGVVASRS